MKTLIAKRDSAFGITKGKSYVVEADNGNDVILVENDVNVKLWVNKDLFESEHLSNAKRIASEAEALAERERIRDLVAEQIRKSCLPGGDIFKYMRGEITIGIEDRVIDKSVESIIGNASENHLSTGNGWKIHKAGMSICSNDYEPNEYIKVLEQLREVMRVPEGENIVTHAKVLRALADALICLQK